MCVFGGGSCALRKTTVKVMLVARYRMDFSFARCCYCRLFPYVRHHHRITFISYKNIVAVVCKRDVIYACVMDDVEQLGINVCAFLQKTARRMAHLINIITQHHMKDNILCL